MKYYGHVLQCCHVDYNTSTLPPGALGTYGMVLLGSSFEQSREFGLRLSLAYIKYALATVLIIFTLVLEILGQNAIDGDISPFTRPGIQVACRSSYMC